MEYIQNAKIFTCASKRNMEFIFKFHSLFSVAGQLLITFDMLHSIRNHYVRCILLANGNASLVNIYTYNILILLHTITNG